MPIGQLPQTSDSCVDCDAMNTDSMVQCYRCESWTHFKCAGVGDNIATPHRDFTCSNCQSEGAMNVPQSLPLHTTITSLPSTSSDAFNMPRNTPTRDSDEEGENFSLVKIGYECKLIATNDAFECQNKEIHEMRKMMLEMKARQKEMEEQNRVLQFQLKKKTEHAVNTSIRHNALSAETNSSSVPVITPMFTSSLRSTHADTPLSTWHPQSLKATKSPMNYVPASNSSASTTYYQRPIIGPGTLAYSTVIPHIQSPIFNQYVSAQESIIPKLTPQQISARKTMKTDLPTFDGSPEIWQLFISFFEQTTSACGFSDQENMVRLMTSLKGKARAHVSGLLTVPQNVPYLVERLRTLFGRPEQIIESQLAKVRRLPPPTLEQLDRLVDYGVAVHNLVSSMHASQMAGYLSSPSILDEIAGRLPVTLRMQWAAFSRVEPIRDLTLFDSWLDALTLDACRINNISMPFKKREGRNPRVNFNEERRTSSEKSNKGSSKNCPVCPNACRSVSECIKFLNADRNGRWDFVKGLRLCRFCLGTHRNTCQQVEKCGKQGCEMPHHPLLHYYKETSIFQEKPTENPKSEMSQREETLNEPTNRLTHKSGTDATLFRVVPVVLKNGTKSVESFAFLDNGSSVTLLDQSVAEQLELSGLVQPLCLQWTNDETRTENESQSVTLTIAGQYINAKSFELKNVRTVRHLGLSDQTIDAYELMERYPHLRDLPIKSYSRAQPMLLIGLAHNHVTMPIRVREGNMNDPIALKTRLGWTICGQTGPDDASTKATHAHICNCQDDHTPKLLETSLDMDAIGITRSSMPLLTSDEKRAISILESTTQRRSDRFETGLLWANDHVTLPDNKPMAILRLNCLARKLKADQFLAANLQKQIDEMEKTNMIRKLSEEEERHRSDRTWYLPVFPVTNPNKPNKVRILLDAAAKFRGVSLNSMLLTGPNEVPLLTQPLLRFRERKIALRGDIKQMFHQVKIRKQDQDAQRFLWPSGESHITYVMQRMTFGATCSPSAAQYVKNLNARSFDESYPRAVRAVIQNHYVDDLLDSVDTEKEAIKLANDIRHIDENAGFIIRNWRSNSPLVQRELNVEDASNVCLDFGAEFEKLLGMWWEPLSDSFTYLIKNKKVDSEVLQGHVIPTKRQVLSLLMSIYDPNGHLMHYTIHLKILLQRIWRSGRDWDDKIEETHVPAWLQWIQRLPELESLKIPRCFLRKINSYNDAEIQLHAFVDASQEAYATVVYLRIKKNGIVEVVQVGAKSRVAPLKTMTVPRLELQAALIGSRYANYIRQTLTIEIQTCHYWSDSTTVIGWLNATNKQYIPFVAFRLSEILELSDVKEWHWVPSHLNTADQAMKSTNDIDLTSNSTWFTGPHFLYETEDTWPNRNVSEVPAPDEDTIRINVRVHQETIIDISRFSKWSRLLRCVAYTYHFLQWKTSNRSENLTAYQLQLAEKYLIRLAQQEEYADELKELKTNGIVGKSSKLYMLSPYLDTDNIIRHKTRLTKPPRNPIFLPSKSRITKLIIQHHHEKLLHIHPETELNELRQQFHIANMKKCIKKVIRSCEHCKIYKVRPLTPKMAPLPETRLATYCPAFSHTGVDYFGPIFVAVKRSKEKRWGVLFTCLTTRAIHIELATSLDVDSCIMAIKSFMRRLGAPKCFYSDHDTNFISAERTLKEELKKLDSQKIANAIVSPTIEWRFNPPLVPYMGGAWERMIKTVKTALYAALPHRNPTEEILRSTLNEIKNLVNSRPLTYIPVDNPEADAITPNHFLKSNPSNFDASSADDSQETLTMTWRTSQSILNRFWKRWTAEYLSEIVNRPKWHEDPPKIQVGNLVILVDHTTSRREWQRGKIVRVHEGPDGRVRSVEVMTNRGKLIRPVSKLAILEVKSSTEESVTVEENVKNVKLRSSVDLGLSFKKTNVNKEDDAGTYE